ncbi:hypothetical protein KIW84_053009 [Lathyrus oleraceus]|uniref:glucan endo-1,3-beta-D-glucosidase n=1 Tax=Pisum sativum TaxID=3888 RepID=A0A9D5AG24_PEA|nr:hypothetical protein KIW84_053009 [Pisum sativum]
MYNAGAFVGVNIGTNVSDLPSASNIVAILKSHQINHVRLYDANPHMLQALSNTGVEAIVIQVMDHVYLQEGPVDASLKLQVCSLHYVLSSTSLLLALMLF